MTTTKYENCMEEIKINVTCQITPVNVRKLSAIFFFKEEPRYKYLSLKESHLQLNIVIRHTPSLVAVICRSCEDSQPVASEEIYFV